MRLRYWLLLLALACVWGAAFLFIKVAVSEASALQVSALRVAIAAALQAALLTHRRPHLNSLSALAPSLLMVALFGITVPFALTAWGTSRVDSGLAAVLSSTIPIFAAVSGSLAAEQASITTRTTMVGLVVGLLGVALVVGAGPGDSRADLLGSGAVLAGASAHGAVAVFISKRLSGEDPIAMSALTLALAGVFLGSPAAAAGLDLSLSWEAWLAIAGLGLLVSGVGTPLFYHLISLEGSTRATLVMYLVPVIALVLGVLVLGETVTASSLLGTILVLTGVYLVGSRPVPNAETVPG